MQPGDDHVLVVARVADDRRPVGHARHVLEQPAALDPQLALVGRVVQLGRADGAGAVDRVEVERRRAAVAATRRGSVGSPSGEPASKVMSWSMNWPKNVVPAVCVGLFGLWAESDGSVISGRAALERVAGVEDPARRADLDQRRLQPLVPGSANGRMLEHPAEVLGDAGW